jgi:hypothetical protein
MKKLLFLFTVLSLFLTSCEKEEIQPNEPTTTSTGTNGTGTNGTGTNGTGTNGTGTWDPFDVQYSFYVSYKIGCASCVSSDVNSMVDTIEYTNKTTGISTLIVVEEQIIQHFPSGILPTYTDSVYFGGNTDNGKIFADTRIGLENTQEGDTIEVFVKFKETGNQHMCQIFTTDSFDSGNINNTINGYTYTEEIIID